MISTKKLGLVTGILACGLSAVLGSMSPAYAYIARTDNPPGTAGTMDSTAKINGGVDFYAMPGTTDLGIKPYANLQNLFRYAADGLQEIYTNGTTDSGGIWHFDHTMSNGTPIVKNNGYLMIGKSTLSAWVTQLHGDQQYATDPSRLYATTFQDANGDTFPVINVSQLLTECGGAFVPGQDANTYDPKVYVSDPPTAQITLPSGNSVQQGTKLLFNAIANIEEYNAYYHYEYVDVVGADGKDYSSAVGPLSGAVSGSQSLTVQTQSGVHTMQEVNGGGNVTTYPPTPHTWINGMDGSAGYSNPNYIDSTNLPNGSYTIYFYVKDYFNRAAAVQRATFSVTGGSGSGGSGGGGSGGGGGKCPAPVVPPKPADYVENYYWSPDGSGGQILTWTDSNWVQVTTTDAQGCPQYKWVDQPKTYTHDYPLYLNNMQVTGLFYDPGSPTNMWSPTNQNASQNNHDQFSDGSSIGGSQALPTFGNPNRSPAVYVRIGGGFSFRLLWTGSPHDMPASASVTYRLINPNGDTNTWTKSFQLLPSTTFNMGDQPTWDPSGNGYPPAATEYGWAYTSVPKYAVTGTPSSYSQLAKWNLTGDSSTASHIASSVTFTTGTGSSVTWNNTYLTQSLGWPTWYFIHQIPDANAPYNNSQPQWSNSYSFKTP